MEAKLVTSAATSSVGNGDITDTAAQRLERLAETAVTFHRANQQLELGGDGYEQTTASPAYARLSPIEQALFRKVYDEMLGHASSAFKAVAAGPRTGVRGVADIIAQEFIEKFEVHAALDHVPLSESQDRASPPNHWQSFFHGLTGRSPPRHPYQFTHYTLSDPDFARLVVAEVESQLNAYFLRERAPYRAAVSYAHSPEAGEMMRGVIVRPVLEVHLSSA